VCLFAAVAASAAVVQEARKPSPSLYDRLGGAYPIAVVVDAFIELGFMSAPNATFRCLGSGGDSTDVHGTVNTRN
jgi:hypothetical protein